MKKAMVVVMMVAVFFGIVSSVFAENAENNYSASDARWKIAGKAAGFAVGFMSGFGFHELGHQAVASTHGVKMDWHWNNGNPEWWAHADGNKLRDVSLGGFAAQIVSTEVILNAPQIPKDNSFVVGWLAYNVINAIAYPIRHELLDGGYDDFKTLEQTGMDTEVLEAGLIAHALFTAYRMHEKTDFPVWVQTTRQEIAIGLKFEW